MANYYCENCGTKQNSVFRLTSGKCSNHPSGNFKGYHKLYEGSEKSQYCCKYCGTKQNSIFSLTSGKCTRHPNGNLKGNHSPAL